MHTDESPSPPLKLTMQDNSLYEAKKSLKVKRITKIKTASSSRGLWKQQKWRQEVANGKLLGSKRF